MKLKKCEKRLNQKRKKGADMIVEDNQDGAVNGRFDSGKGKNQKCF